jgi:hypothetical protein
LPHGWHSVTSYTQVMLPSPGHALPVAGAAAGHPDGLELASSGDESPIEELESPDVEPPSAFVPRAVSEPVASSGAPPSCEEAPPLPPEPHAMTHAAPAPSTSSMQAALVICVMAPPF